MLNETPLRDGPTPPPMTTTGIIGFLVCDGSVLFPVLLLTCAQISQVSGERDTSVWSIGPIHRSNSSVQFIGPLTRPPAQSSRAAFTSLVRLIIISHKSHI